MNFDGFALMTKFDDEICALNRESSRSFAITSLICERMICEQTRRTIQRASLNKHKFRRIYTEKRFLGTESHLVGNSVVHRRNPDFLPPAYRLRLICRDDTYEAACVCDDAHTYAICCLAAPTPPLKKPRFLLSAIRERKCALSAHEEDAKSRGGDSGRAWPGRVSLDQEGAFLARAVNGQPVARIFRGRARGRCLVEGSLIYVMTGVNATTGVSRSNCATCDFKAV